jgi:hypothetical protein
MTQGDSPRFSVLGVSAPDLSVERQSFVLKEVRYILRQFEIAGLELTRSINVDVILAAEMGIEVDRIRRIHGFTPPPYNPKRSAVQAHGITLRDPRESDVRATIIHDQACGRPTRRST